MAAATVAPKAATAEGVALAVEEGAAMLVDRAACSEAVGTAAGRSRGDG